ncbi:MAG: hypothetical protein LQ346_006998 [Caloplaca aetnensis]|nr:MAG: hypothetical protein LQ346_006998 [Caloplaca aetnensis]
MKAPWLSLSVLLLSLSAVAQAYPRLKFRHWLPRYEPRWKNATASCQPRLSDYYENDRTRCRVPCACAADCLLQDLPATIQSNFASAQVILGLLPPMLVFFGPTSTEVAALSTYRPLLAVLVALGSPAINVGNIFRHVDVREPFTRPLSSTSRLWAAWLARQNVVLRSSFSALSYMAALAAIIINVWTAVYVDLRTVSGWRCGALFMPLVWGLLGVLVHAWAMFAVRGHIRGGYKASVKPAIKSTTFQGVSTGQDTLLSETLLWLASLSAIVHILFGVLVLSSLVFISALEAVWIFWLYALSALVCHFVLSCELASMRLELGRAVEDSSKEHREVLRSEKAVVTNQH